MLRRPVLNLHGSLIVWCLLFTAPMPVSSVSEDPAAAVIQPGTSLRAIRGKIIRMVEEGTVPSLAVGVARDGEVLWQEAFGWADRENETRATPDTRYVLASISKSMTGTALMLLVDRGLIDLEEPVNSYLAPLALKLHEGDPSRLTVRRVIDMTAGIPQAGFGYLSGGTAPLSLAEVISRHGIVVYPPGETYSYSNIASGVIEHLIEITSGQSFADFLRREVFLPWGMLRSSVTIQPQHAQDVAVAYASPQQPLPAQPMQVPHASFSVVSSVHDLLRYSMAHLGTPLPGQKEILSAERLRQMHYEKDPNIPESLHALGWFYTQDSPGNGTLISNGSGLGTNTNITLIPAEKLAVVCLTNVTSWDAITDQLAGEIVEAMLPERAGEGEKFRQDYFAKYHDQLYQPTPAFLGHWQGEIKTHARTLPVEMQFDEDGDVKLRFGDDPWTLLNDARFNNLTLTGNSHGWIPYDDRFEQDSRPVELTLRLKENRLYGSVMAHYTGKDKMNLQIAFISAYVHLEKD